MLINIKVNKTNEVIKIICYYFAHIYKENFNVTRDLNQSIVYLLYVQVYVYNILCYFTQMFIHIQHFYVLYCVV